MQMTTSPLYPANENSVPADRSNGYAYSLKGIRVNDAGDVATTAGLLFESQLLIDRHANHIAIADHGRALRARYELSRVLPSMRALLERDDAECLEHVGLVDRRKRSRAHFAHEIFFKCDLRQVNPLALTRPRNIARRNLRERDERSTRIAEVRQAYGIPRGFHRRDGDAYTDGENVLILRISPRRSTPGRRRVGREDDGCSGVIICRLVSSGFIIVLFWYSVFGLLIGRQRT